MFLKIRLPDDIAYGAKIEFETDIVSLANCSEHRNVMRQYPKNYYILKYDVLNSTMVKKLMEFFRITHGKAHSFLFRDWLDFEARGQSLKRLPAVLENNDERVFQLSKVYKIENVNAIENFSLPRKITKPIEGTLKVFDNAAKLLVENDDYECNYDNGIIIFKNKLVDDYVVDFDFDVHVRFDNDSFEYKFDKCRNHEMKEMRLVEIN